jgi:hypothetical protein
MLAIIRCRIFCLPRCYPKTQRLDHTEEEFYLLFCMGVKLGLSKRGRDKGCEDVLK